MKFDKVYNIIVGAVVVVVFKLFGHARASPLCRDDQYWLSITGWCEPCSRICDPPGRHENDCPAFCPNYMYTTTTTPTAVTPKSPQSIYSGPERTGDGFTSTHLAILLGALVGLVVLHLTIGCLVYKKRESLKKRFPLKQILRKIGYRTTTASQQPETPEANQDPQLQVPETMPMIRQNKDRSTETVNDIDLR